MSSTYRARGLTPQAVIVDQFQELLDAREAIELHMIDHFRLIESPAETPPPKKRKKSRRPHKWRGDYR